MNSYTRIALIIVVSLVAGAGAGFIAGTRSGATDQSREHDLIVMMTDEGQKMQRIGETMMQTGAFMQELARSTNNADLASKGKDLEALGERHKADGEAMMGHGPQMMNITGMTH